MTQSKLHHLREVKLTLFDFIIFFEKDKLKGQARHGKTSQKIMKMF